MKAVKDMGAKCHPDLKVKSDLVWLSDHLLDTDYLCSLWTRVYIQTAYDGYQLWALWLYHDILTHIH